MNLVPCVKILKFWGLNYDLPSTLLTIKTLNEVEKFARDFIKNYNYNIHILYGTIYNIIKDDIFVYECDNYVTFNYFDGVKVYYITTNGLLLSRNKLIFDKVLKRKKILIFRRR